MLANIWLSYGVTLIFVTLQLTSLTQLDRVALTLFCGIRGHTNPNGTIWKRGEKKTTKKTMSYIPKSCSNSTADSVWKMPNSLAGVLFGWQPGEMKIQIKTHTHLTLYILIWLILKCVLSTHTRHSLTQTDEGWMKSLLLPECVHTQSPAHWTIY